MSTSTGACPLSPTGLSVVVLEYVEWIDMRREHNFITEKASTTESINASIKTGLLRAKRTQPPPFSPLGAFASTVLDTGIIYAKR